MDLLEAYKSPNLDQGIMPQFRDPAKRKGNYSSAVCVGILGFGVNKDRLERERSANPDLLERSDQAGIQRRNPDC